MAKTADIFAGATLEELDGFQEKIQERRKELLREKAKEIAKTISIGSNVKYLSKGEEVVAPVNAITLDYVSVALNEEKNGCTSKRLKYTDIIEVVD